MASRNMDLKNLIDMLVLDLKGMDLDYQNRTGHRNAAEIRKAVEGYDVVLLQNSSANLHQLLYGGPEKCPENVVLFNDGSGEVKSAIVYNKDKLKIIKCKIEIEMLFKVCSIRFQIKSSSRKISVISVEHNEEDGKSAIDNMDDVTSFLADTHAHMKAGEPVVLLGDFGVSTKDYRKLAKVLPLKFIECGHETFDVRESLHDIKVRFKALGTGQRTREGHYYLTFFNCSEEKLLIRRPKGSTTVKEDSDKLERRSGIPKETDRPIKEERHTDDPRQVRYHHIPSRDTRASEPTRSASVAGKYEPVEQLRETLRGKSSTYSTDRPKEVERNDHLIDDFTPTKTTIAPEKESVQRTNGVPRVHGRDIARRDHHTDQFGAYDPYGKHRPIDDEEESSTPLYKPLPTCKCGSTSHSRTSHHECPLNKGCRCGSTTHFRTSSGDCPLNTGCKCGSTTHLRTSSRECPLNKGCKCGSTSHFRTTHRNCPLNKKS